MKPPIPIRTIATGLVMVTLTAAVVATVVLATDVYLLLFLAVLAGVAFTYLATSLGRIVPFKYGVNLAIVATILVGSVSAAVVFFGVRIEQQMQETSNRLDQSYDQIMHQLEEYPIAKRALLSLPFTPRRPTEADGTNGRVLGDEQLKDNHNATKGPRSAQRPNGQRSQSPESDIAASSAASAGWSNVSTVRSISGKVFGFLGKLFTTTMGATMNVAFVFFVGMFLAAKPQFYRDHFALLFPPDRRTRVTEIMEKLGDALFCWLKGRAASMAITGVGTTVVLWLLGVPLAVTLGVITGVLTFIPTIGAVLALVLSALVAAPQGPATMAGVVCSYAVLQLMESNLITPLIQQRQTSVPPPVLLWSHLMMGVLTGFLGVLISTPLAAAIIVLVNEAYVVDVLGNANSS